MTEVTVGRERRGLILIKRAPARFSHPPSRKIRDPDLRKNARWKQAPVPQTHTPFHAAPRRAASHSSHRGRNRPSPCRQDERQYNQRGQQHARYKRKSRLQWVRLEMAASLCPMHRHPHGSLLLADPIIYPKNIGAPATSPTIQNPRLLVVVQFAWEGSSERN